MTEQQPMGTTRMPVQPTAEERAAETSRLNQQLYDFRKTVDPLLYERVIAYHPHANVSDDAFGVFVADYHRVAGEAQQQPPAAGQPAPAPHA
jgi:hypothetical protein